MNLQEDVEDAITAVENKLDRILEAQKRFFAIKLLEKDDKIIEQMKTVPDVSAEIKGSWKTNLMMIPRVLSQMSVMFISPPSSENAVQNPLRKETDNIR